MDTHLLDQNNQQENASEDLWDFSKIVPIDFDEPSGVTQKASETHCLLSTNVENCRHSVCRCILAQMVRKKGAQRRAFEAIAV